MQRGRGDPVVLQALIGHFGLGDGGDAVRVAAPTALRQGSVGLPSTSRLALAPASAELHADKDIIQAAVAQNNDVSLYADPQLEADRDSVSASIEQNCSALQFVPYSRR